MQYKETGEKDYEALARLGHHESRLVQASFTDLLPKDLTDCQAAALLQKPSEEEIERKTRETQEAFDRILAKNQSAGAINSNTRTSMVKFTPQGSDEAKIVKIYETPKDPFDPPKFSHKRAPKPPPSPPPPVLHSPPRKATAEEQKNWAIPPCISNWKNAKGYTIALDKRLAADGRGLRENKINEGFATFAESLYLAESHAREEVEKRAVIEKKLAEKERIEKEETLRALAAKAREEKLAVANEIRRESDDRDRRDHSERRDRYEDSRSSESRYGPIKVHGADANLTVREREELRRQMSKEGEKEIRLARMGPEQRAKYLERMENRDISEKIALGQQTQTAVPETSKEGIFDQRLFDQSAGIGQGLADDESYNVYDKPLFTGSAVNLIYRPTVTGDDVLSDDEPASLAAGKVKRAGKSFQGADEVSRTSSGPVEFEKDESTEIDPFGLDSFLSAAKKRANDEKGDQQHSKRR